jgi:hypothetical protein
MLVLSHLISRTLPGAQTSPPFRLDVGERWWWWWWWCPGLERPDQREGRCPRVFGEAYPVSCSRYRCPVHRARTAAGGRDAGEGVDRRPGVDVYPEPVHAVAEVRSPVTRWVPCVPDRVLASGFSGRGLIGRVHVRTGDRAVRAGQQNRGGESVVRRKYTRTIRSAGVQTHESGRSAPDDHFAAGPDCRVLVSGGGREGRAGGYPTVGGRVISAASVRRDGAPYLSTPNDHFTAGPDCRVKESGTGRVGGACGCPRIRAGIVSPAGV